MRVHGLNEAYLFAPSPALDLLLATYRRVWVEEMLIVSQPCQVVSAGEAGGKFVFVLKYAAAQIARHARIQYVRPGPVRHDVNVK
jgi:hypothetical protein